MESETAKRQTEHKRRRESHRPESANRGIASSYNYFASFSIFSVCFVLGHRHALACVCAFTVFLIESVKARLAEVQCNGRGI